jgi:hypothetical protein
MRMAKTGKAGGKVPEEVQVKQQRCLDLVVQGGLTYAEIADEVGYSGESSVRAAVNAVLQRADNAGAEVARPRMIARAEALWIKAYRLVERGEQMFVETGDPDVLIKGLNSADRALTRLSKLHHLEGPDVSVHFGADVGELERLKAEAMALLDGSAGGVVDAEVVDSGAE